VRRAVLRAVAVLMGKRMDWHGLSTQTLEKQFVDTFSGQEAQ
jgi:hypothetical protein